MESPVIFLQNDTLILNGKENKEAGAICFELRVPRKKNKEIFQKVPSKIYGSNFIMEKHKIIFWFVNISKHHHREMGYSKNHSDQEINKIDSLNILGKTVKDLPIFIKQTDPIVVAEMQIGASGDR